MCLAKLYYLFKIYHSNDVLHHISLSMRK